MSQTGRGADGVGSAEAGDAGRDRAATRATLTRGLIVSCQAREGNPLRGPQHMAAMARAAVAGGAVAIRAEGVDDIAAVRAVVDVPIIGLVKRGRSLDRPYITPDLDAAHAVAQAGADWIAIDATDRARAGGPVSKFVPAILEATGKPILADVATLTEGVAAADAGASAVATTLSGYVGGGRGGHPSSDGPDLDLVSALAGAVSVPVVAEGRYATPTQVAAALERGAWAVVVGTAITNPIAITAGFVTAFEKYGPSAVKSRERR